MESIGELEWSTADRDVADLAAMRLAAIPIENERAAQTLGRIEDASVEEVDGADKEHPLVSMGTD